MKFKEIITMRTFIFVKNERDEHNELHRIIVGMTTGNMYPSDSLLPSAAFAGCQCIEVTDKCHIDLGIYKD